MRTDMANKANMKSFIVYGMDCPVSEELRFEHRGLMDDGSERPISALGGSLILISGGLQTTAEDVPLVFKDGLCFTFPEVRRFAERAVASVVGAESRICLLYLIESILKNTQHKVAFQDALFDVADSCDGRVCAGPSRSLWDLEWTAGASAFSNILLTATPGNVSELERELFEAAAKGSALKSVYGDFWRMSAIPELSAPLLHELSLIADLEGPDGCNLVIDTAAVLTADLHSSLRQLALDLGIDLYYAGNLMTPDPEGRAFADYPDWATWRPVPSHWQVLTQ